MQTLQEIREMLRERGFAPQKRFGQNFMVDQNLLLKLLELAGPAVDETVLEVGPGTGSLTEELLTRAARVVAVEVDRGLASLLRDRLGGRANFTLIEADVMAGKHAVAPAVLAALGPRASLIANLPYSIATPLVAECLLSSWRAAAAGVATTRFDRLTFTVQREVGDRLAAGPGSGAYGPVSVIASLLGSVHLGPGLPCEAFWPRPRVASRIVRVDFNADRAAALTDASVLTGLLAAAFGQRRKQIGSIFRKGAAGHSGDLLRSALAAAGIEPTRRAEEVPPEAFRRLANAVAGADAS